MDDQEKLKYFLDEKCRLEAIISYIKNGGGPNYDLAPPHIFINKEIPDNLQGKTSSDFLHEYEDLLKRVLSALAKHHQYD